MLSVFLLKCFKSAMYWDGPRSDGLTCPPAADGEREAELEAGAGDADRERPAAVRQSTAREGSLAEPHVHLPPSSNAVGVHMSPTHAAL